jgi:hypothetical protein
MITIRQFERRHGLAGEMLKAGGSVDDSPIKEHPTIRGKRGAPVGKCHCEYSSNKGCFVSPGKRQASIFHLFLNHPPARLLHNRVPASMKLRQQRGFTAARASGNHDKSIQSYAPAPRIANIVTDQTPEMTNH